MAKAAPRGGSSGGRAPTRKGGRAEWRGWIDYPLTIEQLAAIKKLDCSGEWFSTWASTLADDGIAMAIRADEYNACYQCTLTRTDQENPDAGLGLTGRGSTVVKAFRQAVYVHSEVLDGDWSAYWNSKGKRLSIDD